MTHHIIACPVFELELQAIMKQLSAPEIHLMDYSVHINPNTMEKELQDNINAIENSADKMSILVGSQCEARQPITTIASQHKACLPTAHNCIEMILGKQKTDELQQNRTIIMTPGWITMIQQSIRDGNWRVEDARINLGWYDQILMLDTGTMPLTDEIIMEFFELTQVPIDILKTDLDHFTQVVQSLL